MKIRICESQIKPYSYISPSASQPGVDNHTVPQTLLNDAFCTCKGFQHRNECRHIREVEAAQCHWMDRREDQKAVFNDPIIDCPRCGRRVVEYDLEPEL
jgi:SWIM zinc finger